MRRLASLTIAALGTLLVLWYVLARVLKADQGLDLTDEGFYLVAADPPNLQAAWLFPFGWHTRPLFELVNWDIAAFRTLGAVILVGVAGVLGWLASSVVVGDQRTRTSTIYKVTTTAVAALGVLVYYTSMLRVPSYNWLGLVGTSVCLIGVCLLMTRHSTLERSWRTALAPGLLSSVGLFLSLPAKPSIAAFLVFAAFASIWVVCGRDLAVRWTIWAVAVVPLWVGLAVLAKVWPTDFIEVFSLVLQMPTPDPAQTVFGAASELSLVPRDILTGVTMMQDTVFVVFMVVIAGLLVPPLLKKRWWIVRFAGLTTAGIVALAVAGAPVPLLNATGTPFGLARPSTSTCLMIIVLAAALARWRLSSEPRGDESRLCRARLVLILLFVFSVFGFAFGSDNGVFGQASMAGGLVLLSAALATGGSGLDRYTLATTMVVAATTVAVVVAGLVGGWRFPYRSAPLAEQTLPTIIGNHQSILRLDPTRSAEISGLAEQARRSGFIRETPLVDVSYTWHPGMVYALGGRVPQSLQLTIFGYSSSHDITDFHLSSPFLDYPFEDAWLITSAPQVLELSARTATDFTLSKLEQVTGRSLPEDFECISMGDFLLWKPLDEQKPTDSCDW